MSKILNFIVFLIVSFFILIEFNGFLEIERFSSRIKVRAFLAQDANPNSLSLKIKKEEGIQECTLISKEKALREFKRGFTRLPGVGQEESEVFLQEVGENPFPASFKISLKSEYRNPAYLDSLKYSLMALPRINKVIYGKEWAQNIWTISKYFRMASYGIGGLLFFLFIFTLIITLKQRFLILKDRYKSLQEVGVSKWKLRLKFSLRNLIENLVLSALTILATYYIWSLLLLPRLNWSLFLPINFIATFIGGCGFLSFLISLVITRRI
ncbi:permease-like cell division protein FtsX [candidate division WOR-3 bacterium]|nr:permease-like cell division protein FtsX [candidate division WOR-3 bacterium]